MDFYLFKFHVLYTGTQVRALTSPSVDEFQSVLQSLDPSIVYLQGEQIENREEIRSLRWGDVDLGTSDALCGVFGSTLPSTVSNAQCLHYGAIGTKIN